MSSASPACAPEGTAIARRDRVVALLAAAAIHVAVFAPTVGSSSSVLERGFHPQAERVLDGEKPYSEVGFEYPPLALPLVVAPAAVSDGLDGYEVAFELEMLAFDLAIVAVLALAVAGPRRRVAEALGVYTLGVVAVSGVVLGDSSIEYAPLALARFDLAVALLVLAAVLARERERSALWSGLLGAATAVKGFPALLFPNLLQGERDVRRAAFWALVPVAAATGIVLGFGDEFVSAVTYHTDRDLQIETLGATPLLVSHLLFGSEAHTVTGAGGFNLDAPGAAVARAVSIVLTLGSVLALIYAGLRRRTPPLVISTAILAAVIAFAPVLSPQFLLWVLPLSAVAYGAGRENLVLIACLVLTQIGLHDYAGVIDLSGAFVWTFAARNALLLVYLALVVIRVFNDPDPYPEPDG